MLQKSRKFVMRGPCFKQIHVAFTALAWWRQVCERLLSRNGCYHHEKNLSEIISENNNFQELQEENIPCLFV